MLKFFRSRFPRILSLAILGLLLSACQSATAGTSDLVTPTLVQILPTATDVLLPATATAIPTESESEPILTSTQPATETPALTQTAIPTSRGALTWDQEQRLYQTSLNFLAETEEDATIIVRDQIDYLESLFEHPSLACGPISAAILRDAGLLPPDADIHGFWQLDPRTRTSQIVLETHFPEERYEWYQFDTATTKFNFNAFPLLPGDFIYLYAGINGTFEHIITVTRVDEDGRAYTVTNLATDEGFVIRELMLYDPNNPGEGQFYDWMNREINGMLGMTGDGGFDLWRPTAPVKDYVTP